MTYTLNKQRISIPGMVTIPNYGNPFNPQKKQCRVLVDWSPLPRGIPFLLTYAGT